MAITWRKVDSFVWATAGRIQNFWHQITIQPHGGLLNYQTYSPPALAEAPPLPSVTWPALPYNGGLANGVIHTVMPTGLANAAPHPVAPGGLANAPQTPHRRFDLAQAPIAVPPTYWVDEVGRRPHATGPGNVRLDMNRRLNIPFQVSRVQYQPYGLLTCDTLALDRQPSLNEPLVLSWIATMPTGTAVVGRLYDGTTGTELTETSRGAYYAVYQPNPGQVLYRPKFQLYSSGTYTPILQSYTVTRNGYVQRTPTTPFYAATATLLELSITDAEADPSHKSGHVTIEDLADTLSTLRLRAGMPAAVLVYDDSLPKPVVMLQGYAPENQSEKVSHDLEDGNDFPSPEWRQVHSSLLGKWVRLHSQLNRQRIFLAHQDPNGGAPVYEKVTDIIRLAIINAGFLTMQVDVPDLPVTFVGGEKDSLMLDIGANIGDAVCMWARDWLGAYIIFDENAGPADSLTGFPIGMWRLRQPPILPAFGGPPLNVLMTFSTSGPGAGMAADDIRAYPPGTTYIVADSLREWVDPPEATEVSVLGAASTSADAVGGPTVKQTLINPKAVNIVGSDGSIQNTADPTSPDYTWGGNVPLLLTDAAAGGIDASSAQSNVNLQTLLLFSRTAYARDMKSWTSPLVFVPGPSEMATISDGNGGILSVPAYQSGQYRPLMHYDPVVFGDNELDVVSVVGTGGTVSITVVVNGNTYTVSVPYNASAATVQSDLESQLGAGNVAVTGSLPGGIGISLTGTLAGTPATVSVDGSALTGTGAGATAEQVTEGNGILMFIRSNNPAWDWDGAQMCHIEAQAPPDFSIPSIGIDPI